MSCDEMNCKREFVERQKPSKDINAWLNNSLNLSDNSNNN